jgi:hypothetical protein
MLIRTTSLAAAALAASCGIAHAGIKAGTYSIAIVGACDTLTITVDSSGDAYGNSNAANCDTSAVVGSVAKLAASVEPGGAVIQVGGDLGFGPTEAWNWDFNLKTKAATLRSSTGTNILSDTFAFTYTLNAKVKPQSPGTKPATSTLLSK